MPSLTKSSVYFSVAGALCSNTTAGLNFGDLMLEATGLCTDNATSFTFLTLNSASAGRSGFALRLVDSERGVKGHKHFKKSDLYYFESPPGSGMEWANLSEGDFLVPASKV